MDNDKQTARYKATEYLFDLGNVALENGFKTDEHWEICMSTSEEKKTIEKQYYPTVAAFVLPELIDAAFRLVKSRSNQIIKEQVISDKKKFVDQPPFQYLVAYNPDRLRR